MISASVLVRYFAALDIDDLEAAVSCMAPTIELSIHMPSGVRRVTGHDDLREYLAQRGRPTHRHVAAHVTTDGEVETVVGSVIESSGDIISHFVGVVLLSDEGTIARYQVISSPDFSLIG